MDIGYLDQKLLLTRSDKIQNTSSAMFFENLKTILMHFGQNFDPYKCAIFKLESYLIRVCSR